jgi:Metallo-peptidase family M12B Reprolysin-like
MSFPIFVQMRQNAHRIPAKHSLFIGLLLIITSQLEAQIAPNKSHTFNFDWVKTSLKLKNAPAESLTESVTTTLTFSIPQPDGSARLFLVYDSPIMDAEFQRQQPTFKTYKIIAADNPSVSGRMMTSQFGLNAIIMSENGTVGIRPKDIKNPIQHEVYTGDGTDFTANRLLESPPSVVCGFDEHNHLSPTHIEPPKAEGLLGVNNGANRRTFRFAAVATGHFTVNNGGTLASAQAVITASVNAIQAFYDRELAVRFTLLTPAAYLDTLNDPFIGDITHFNATANTTVTGDSRTNQATEGVNLNFAVGDYDIGHIFHNSTGTVTFSGGGVAGLSVVCSNGTSRSGGDTDGLTGYNKAAGWSGSGNNTTNGWYRLFAHEIGHMFSMNHTFNGINDLANPASGNCGTGNHSQSTAYEVGSGTTIMSYSGLCGAQNVPSGGIADNYFHVNSLESAIAFMGGISCQTTTASGNTPPTASVACAGPFTIPRGTPFTVTGSSTDANSDQIFYSWEQYDEDGSTVRPTHGLIGASAAANSAAPLFRSYPPTTSPSRTFPDMSLVVANNYASNFEALPTVDRTLNFKLTTRDFNTNGGGMTSAELAVTVSGAAFSVSAPNGGESLAAGSVTTVTWNSGGTTGYCTNVGIKMSIDGGLTYPYTLLASTPNDGSQSVTIPSGVSATTSARIKVECADNTLLNC